MYEILFSHIRDDLPYEFSKKTKKKKKSRNPPHTLFFFGRPKTPSITQPPSTGVGDFTPDAVRPETREETLPYPSPLVCRSSRTTSGSGNAGLFYGIVGPYPVPVVILFNISRILIEKHFVCLIVSIL